MLVMLIAQAPFKPVSTTNTVALAAPKPRQAPESRHSPFSARTRRKVRGGVRALPSGRFGDHTLGNLGGLNVLLKGFLHPRRNLRVANRLSPLHRFVHFTLGEKRVHHAFSDGIILGLIAIRGDPGVKLSG